MLTVDQAKVQMSMWSIWSSPLFMGNDLTNIAPGHKEVLLNKYVIGINQDPMGILGEMKNQVIFQTFLPNQHKKFRQETL